MMNVIDICRVCGGNHIHFDKDLQSFLSNEVRHFFVCTDCNTIMDSSDTAPDMDIDHGLLYDFTPYVKHYIEVGAGLYCLASELQLLSMLTSGIKSDNENSIKYLDVGSGFGFSVHMSQQLGWDATGVEPSSIGKIGSQLLELNIVDSYLENSTLTENQFNLISASESIEHVQNPDTFIQIISRYLAPKGILLLTTPNAEAIIGGDKIEQEWMEGYAPGSHFNLLSSRSINLILLRNNFSYVKVIFAEGSSGKKRLVVLASKDNVIPDNLDFSFANSRGKVFLKEYLTNILIQREQKNIKDILYSGVLYRLFELLVNEGKYEEAMIFSGKIDEFIQDIELNKDFFQSVKINTFEEYLDKFPAYVGHYYLYKGILYLNFLKNYDKAIQYFQFSGYLSKIEEQVALGFYPGNWYIRARVNEGLAFLYDGKQHQAIQIFDSLLEFPEKIPSDIWETLNWSKGIAHLQIRENHQSITSFTDILIKKYSENNKPELHILLAFNQSLEDLRGEISSQLKKNFDSTSDKLMHIYSQDKSMLLQQLDAYEGIIHRGIDKIDRISGKLKILFSILEIPSRIYRKLFKSNDWVVSQDGLEITVGEMLYGRSIQQQIISSSDNISSIVIKIGTFNRINTSQLYIDILDEEKKQIRRISKNASLFDDNRLHTFSFDPIPNSQGKKYWLRISSNASRGNAITLWCDRQSFSQSHLVIDSKKSSNTLIYELGYLPTINKVSEGIKDILIITPDKLGRIRIGLGMRHWEISKALASQGLAVTLATPHPIDRDLQGEGFELSASLSEKEILTIAQKHKFVMVQGDILLRYPTLEASGQQIIVDMVTPFHIEDIEKGQKEFEHGYNVIRKCLIRGDYFVCGNESQRIYWLGMLTALGRINRETRDENAAFYSLIDIAGFGIPDEPPVKSRTVMKGVFSNIEQEDFVIIWMGGIWDWLDPLTLIQGVHKAHQKNARIKLFFPAYRQSNGNPSLMAEKAKNLCIEIDALDKSVFFNEYPVPYQERGNYLLESDVGVVCQAANFETQISARTRVLDYIWAGLPILMNEGDEWCELVRRYDLGIVVSGGSIDDWKDAILKLFSDSEARKIKIANIEKIKPQYHWKRLVEPIVKYMYTKDI